MASGCPSGFLILLDLYEVVAAQALGCRGGSLALTAEAGRLVRRVWVPPAPAQGRVSVCHCPLGRNGPLRPGGRGGLHRRPPFGTQRGPGCRLDAHSLRADVRNGRGTQAASAAVLACVRIAQIIDSIAQGPNQPPLLSMIFCIASCASWSMASICSRTSFTMRLHHRLTRPSNRTNPIASQPLCYHLDR